MVKIKFIWVVLIFIFVPLMGTNATQNYLEDYKWTFTITKFEVNETLKDTIYLERSNEHNPDSLLAWVYDFDRIDEDSIRTTGSAIQQVRTVYKRTLEHDGKNIYTFKLDLPKYNYLANIEDKLLAPIASDILQKGITLYQAVGNNNKKAIEKIIGRVTISPDGVISKSDEETNIIEKAPSEPSICSYTVKEKVELEFKKKNYECWLIEVECRNNENTIIADYFYNDELGFMKMVIRTEDYTSEILLIDLEK